jgi:hypothetical protein
MPQYNMINIYIDIYLYIANATNMSFVDYVITLSVFGPYDWMVGWFMNGELENIWKKAVVVLVEVQNLSGGAEQTHEKSRPG